MHGASVTNQVTNNIKMRHLIEKGTLLVVSPLPKYCNVVEEIS